MCQLIPVGSSAGFISAAESRPAGRPGTDGKPRATRHARTKPKHIDPTQEIRAAIARSDTTDLSTAMQRAYATTFTAAELAFVAEYSNSEIGKRVQRKMPGYVAKVPLPFDFGTLARPTSPVCIHRYNDGARCSVWFILNRKPRTQCTTFTPNKQVHPAMKAYAKEIFEDIEEEKNKGGKGKGAKKKGGGIEVVAEDAAAASTSSEL